MSVEANYSHLLKLRHLEFSAYYREDYGLFRKLAGLIRSAPCSIQELKKLNLNGNQLGFIDTLYNFQRTHDRVDICISSKTIH